MPDRRDFIRQSSLAGAGLLFANNLMSTGKPTILFDDPKQFVVPTRQVHLDFHNSELFEDLAKSFDPEQFASTLKKAYVNSVTAFGRCHHGYIYHDTKFKERRHPHLHRNLLKEQIEACHKQNIRVPVYVTVQWDHYTSTHHPEWLMRDENGTPMAYSSTNVFKPIVGFYNHLDIATPYIDFLKAYLKDLFEAVPVDGLFLDIHHVLPNANQTAIEGMLKKGLDPTKESVRLMYNNEVMRDYKRDLTEFIRSLDKNCTIFYNSGHIGPQIKNTIPANTHLELESLPSGGWGYLHFPLTCRYARNLGKDLFGMTGKFHTSWGDFHSLKNEAALEFETSMMIALNAKCSIGDQLHPQGKLDDATYQLIGKTYQKIAQKEPWCENAKAVVEIGVLSTEEFGTPGQGGRTPGAMMGVVRILQEGAHQFDVIDSESSFERYKLIILPDEISVDAKLKDKLQAHLQAGGAVISSFKSGLTPDGAEFALTAMGVSLVGEAPYSPDFLVTKGEISKGLPETELVMYMKGMQVKAASGAEVLVQTNTPYFNREWNHFSSHKHTPSSGKPGYPGIVRSGRSIYFMHPIFAQYNKNAAGWCKRLVLNAINMLLPSPLIKHNGPSGIVTTLNEQAAKSRRILHLLYYTPERRGQDFDVVEDVVPLYELNVSVRSQGNVRKVALVPQNTRVPFKVVNGRIEFSIPELRGHQMIEIS
jgi:hypothetical protein